MRVGKGDKAVTYEKAHPPHYIAHRKGWLSLHTGTAPCGHGGGGGRTPTPPRPITCDPTRPIGNLDGERCAAQRAVEDSFVRRFLHGTFPGCLADEAVLKRRSNSLLVCLLLLRRLPPSKLCFLLGYAETLLSHLYKCPVRIEAQTVPDAAVYKYL